MLHDAHSERVPSRALRPRHLLAIAFPDVLSMEKREIKAKSVCNGCPVRFECLEEAYEISEPFGVWGGMNEVERKRNLVLAD